jgi:glycosyltransferase involved in cell wall biosynthesis
MQPFYDEAAILCMTSSFEGWPMSVAEAQANGVVPVMFDSFDGAREMVSSPDEGVLVTPYDEEAYAISLTQLALDDSWRRQMQDGVIRKAKSYSTDRTGKKWIQMLKKL